MSFRGIVNKHRQNLSDADLSIANEILSHPAEAPLWRGEEVAKRVNLHPAAATRFAQALGFKGYIELRAELRQELNNDLAGAGDRFRQLLDESADSTILATMIKVELEAISAMPKFVAQSELDQAADILGSTRKIYLFAAGHATTLVSLAARRFHRFGYTVVVLQGSARDIAESLQSMREDDVLLAFAFRQSPSNLELVLKISSHLGAKSILITDKLHTLENAPDMIISAPRGQHEGFTSLTVPMTITNAMILTLSHRYPDLLTALDSIQQTLDELK